MWQHLPLLFDQMMGNVWGNGIDLDRDNRIATAWASFDALEQRENQPSTKTAIENRLVNATFSKRHIDQWPVWAGKKNSGTALLMADISFDLEAQLQSRGGTAKADVVKQAKERLLQTLIGFTDLYADPMDDEDAESGDPFHYSVTAWDGSLPRQVISEKRSFGLMDLMNSKVE